MSMNFLRRGASADVDTTGGDERDEIIALLSDRLTSLDGKCLEGLVQGLSCALKGNFTCTVVPVTTPIANTTDDAVLAELVRLFNSMLAKAQAAIEGYETLRAQLREAITLRWRRSPSGCTACLITVWLVWATGCAPPPGAISPSRRLPWRSTPRSRPHAPVTRAAGSRSWPKRSAS